MAQKAARSIAALGDLDVGPGRARRRAGQLEQVAHARGLAAAHHDVDQRALLGESDDGVGLRQRGRELLAVALGHAPRDDHAGAGLAAVGERERDVDRLLACGLDEGARVHDDEVGLGGRCGRGQAVGEQRGDDLVGVDRVLRTAERFDVKPLSCRRIGGHSCHRTDVPPYTPRPWTNRPCGAHRAEPSIERDRAGAPIAASRS